MSEKYHPYVFDAVNRRFVGAFEEMYQAEDRDGFDSWHQEDVTDLRRRLALLMIDRYTFTSILDIGCGKGSITAHLKKANNYVKGVDLSETAIQKARVNHPSVEFVRGNALEVLKKRQYWELISFIGCLSYMEDWRDVLNEAKEKAGYLFLSVYLPPDPIGFIKRFDELREALSDLSVKEEVLYHKDTLLLMLENKKSGQNEP